MEAIPEFFVQKSDLKLSINTIENLAVVFRISRS